MGHHRAQVSNCAGIAALNLHGGILFRKRTFLPVFEKRIARWAYSFAGAVPESPGVTEARPRVRSGRNSGGPIPKRRRRFALPAHSKERFAVYRADSSIRLVD